MPHVTPTVESLLARMSSGSTSSAELEQASGMSQSWVSATLRSLIAQGRVVRIGARRGARYGQRREIASIGSAWPLYRIGRNGEPAELGVLYALAANEYYLEASKAAIAEGFAPGALSSGIPYLLQDQRPGGFLGRAIPRRYPQLHAPQRVQDWTDEQVRRGGRSHSGPRGIG